MTIPIDDQEIVEGDFVMESEMPDDEVYAAHDDLTRVRGIGPKFAAALNAAGITTFDHLAAATPDQLRDAINPSPMQRLDFAGWSAHAAELAGSRGVAESDDLTKLEGIGPVYAAKLRENGISTYAELAAADEETLGRIIDAPAWRRINYGDWISQAQLAAAGDKIALLELQERLFRRDNRTSRPVSPFRYRHAWTRAPSSTRWAPRRCSARATCSTFPRGGAEPDIATRTAC